MGPIPDLDALIARLQAYVRSLLGGGGGPRGRFTGGRGLALLAIGVVALWLASGFYRVQPDELGVVLRFGAFDRTTQPGLNYQSDTRRRSREPIGQSKDSFRPQLSEAK